VVVDGFIHLQQYHIWEIARGLAGTGTYQLRQDYPVCSALPPTRAFVVKPDEIVPTLQQPASEVQVSAVSGKCTSSLFKQSL